MGISVSVFLYLCLRIYIYVHSSLYVCLIKRCIEDAQVTANQYVVCVFTDNNEYRLSLQLFHKGGLEAEASTDRLHWREM